MDPKDLMRPEHKLYNDRMILNQSVGISMLADTAITVQNDGCFVFERPWFSTRPVFFRQQGGLCEAATDWRTLIGLSGDGPDIGYIKDYLRFQTPLTHRTFSSNIRLVRHGERLSVSGDSLLIEKLPFPNQTLPADTIQDRLCELLGGAQESCFHLSSGLDSSLLVLLASRKWGNVWAATVCTRGRGAKDELDIVQRLSDEIGAELSLFDFTDMNIWEEGKRLMTALGYPVAHPSHLVRYLLDRAIVESGSTRTIVTGRGPDEVLGGYEVHRPAFSDVGRHLARITCTDNDRITSIFSDNREGDAGANHTAFFSDSISLQKRLLYDLSSIYESWNILEADFSRSLGVQYISPFLAPDVMATLFLLSDDEKVSDGNQKIFLRTMFADIYPKYILNNPKMGLTIDLREYMVDQSVESIVEIIWGRSEFGQRFLNRDACQRLVEDTLSGRANCGWQIWNLYLCELACQKLKPSI